MAQALQASTAAYCAATKVTVTFDCRDDMVLLADGTLQRTMYAAKGPQDQAGRAQTH